MYANHTVGTHGTKPVINDNGTVSAHGFDWVVIDSKEVDHAQGKRLWLHVRKPKGRKIFCMVIYENGLVSPAC